MKCPVPCPYCDQRSPRVLPDRQRDLKDQVGCMHFHTILHKLNVHFFKPLTYVVELLGPNIYILDYKITLLLAIPTLGE